MERDCELKSQNLKWEEQEKRLDEHGKLESIELHQQICLKTQVDNTYYKTTCN